jgi:hypothetical protein
MSLEHATDPAARTDLARAGGRRLGLALAGVALTIGALGAAAVLLTTRFAPAGLAYVPSGTPIVMELRPNQPAGQRGALGTLLAKLPDITGGASVADRVDAALERLVREASDGKHTYAGDLEPYLAGPVIIAIPAIEATPGTADGGAAQARAERMLAVLAPQGSAGCPGLEAGATVSVERYRDVDIRVPGADRAGPACAAAGNLLLLGDLASLRAALDAKAAGRDVSSDAPYQAAARAVPDEHAAWLYVDGRAAARMTATAGAVTASAPPSLLSPALAGLSEAAPEWLASSVRFINEGAIVETVTPDPRPALLATASGSPRATIGPDALSVIAPVLPASTIAALELHQAGPLLAALAARNGATSPATPGAGSASDLARLGALVALVGGDALLGSVDQAALAITRQGSTIGGGIVLRTTDAAGTTARLDQLRTLLALAAPGTGETDYHGARILTIPVAGLLGGGAGGLPFGAPGTIPGTGGALAPPAGLPAGLTLEVAAYQSYIVVGIGDAFVRAVIDTPVGSALADQTTYRTTMGLVGSTTFAQAYLDLPDLLALAEPRAATDRVEAFGRDLRPYLAPIAAVAMGATSSGGLATSRSVIYVP